MDSATMQPIKIKRCSERLQKATAGGCKACGCFGGERMRRKNGWVRKWREEGRQSGRGRQVAGKGAAERRRQRRRVMQATSVAASAARRVQELEGRRK